jgi:hypothetical protein
MTDTAAGRATGRFAAAGVACAANRANTAADTDDGGRELVAGDDSTTARHQKLLQGQYDGNS